MVKAQVLAPARVVLADHWIQGKAGNYFVRSATLYLREANHWTRKVQSLANCETP
jgi:hypothetical protein